MQLKSLVALALQMAQSLLKRRQIRSSSAAKDAALEELLQRKVSPMSEVKPSAQGQLNSSDLLKVLRDAAIVGGGVAVARVIELLPGVDFGPYKDVVVPVLIVILGLVRRWLAGQVRP